MVARTVTIAVQPASQRLRAMAIEAIAVRPTAMVSRSWVSGGGPQDWEASAIHAPSA
ncbi:hypothetical protein [Streptomyces sp. CS62]|uniref:hypothetical protein n=1 Tax=Streptomyces sp. CS62 TaxID=3119268 RepID=UPI002F92525F